MFNLNLILPKLKNALIITLLYTTTPRYSSIVQCAFIFLEWLTLNIDEQGKKEILV
jgi:hypothetical protein